MKYEPRFDVVYNKDVNLKSKTMELITHEEMLDKLIGEKGTPRRDKYDKELEDFLIGEAIKKNSSSAEPHAKAVGELVGVKSQTK